MNHCCNCSLGDVSKGQFCAHDGGMYLCPNHKDNKIIRVSEYIRIIEDFDKVFCGELWLGDINEVITGDRRSLHEFLEAKLQEAYQKGKRDCIEEIRVMGDDSHGSLFVSDKDWQDYKKAFHIWKK